MYERGTLRREGTGWRWPPDAPERLDFARNVVDAVLERLSALPAETARALGVAARVGHRFDVGLLAHALERPEADVAASLSHGIEAGLLRPETEDWGLLAYGAGERAEGGTRFVHDRVQEAALRLLSDDEAPQVHLRLARRLMATATPSGDTHFEILEHARPALALFLPDERLRLGGHALEACAAAVRSAAFGAALRACELGLVAVGDADPALWERLCTRAVEVADAAADDPAIDRHAEALIAGASTVAARGPAYWARIRALTRAGRYAEAIAAADAFLIQIGRRTETRLRLLPLLLCAARVLWTIRGRTPQALVDGPAGTDPTHVATVRVQIAATTALAALHPKVLPLDILRSMRDVLSGGVTPEGLFVWTGWALLNAKVAGRVEQGIAYCQLALARAERMRAHGTWVGIASILNSMLTHWVTPLSQVGEALRQASERALELGEVSSALQMRGLGHQLEFFEGRPLAEVDLAFRQLQALGRQYRVPLWTRAAQPYREAVAMLRGQTNPTPAVATNDPDDTFTEHTRAVSTMVSTLFLGDRAAALATARRAPVALRTPMQYPGHFIWFTYRAVALLRAAAVGLLSPAEARALIRPDRRALERWVAGSPGRRYRLLWIDATDAVLRGHLADALPLFEAAIDEARAVGVCHDAALLCEHAAEVATATGRPRLATLFLEDARAGYHQWGADAKADALLPRSTAPLSTRSTSSTTSRSVDLDLDLETMFRASIALSGEIRLDRLVCQVVAVTLQNAGATRGFLVTEREGGPFIELGLGADGAALAVPGTPLSAAPDALAATVVHYVARTGQQLVLADGASDARFALDPYLRSRTTASILCTPLEHKGQRTGIIYLENHLVGGCFTPARLRTVQVLASQAAVAIENARLVDTLEAKVAERTGALQAALEQTRAQHAQLVSSHEALVQSEKMAALGQLVAGVAHELNTPLGAIRASVGNLSAALDGVLGDLFEVLAESPPAQRAAWVALVRTAGESTVPRTSREERTARRRLTARLVEAGVQGAEELASVLVDIGLDPEAPLPTELLGAPRSESLLRGAYNVAAIGRNGGNIRMAADRAAKIVFALKTYAHPGDATGASSQASLAENLDTVLTLYQNLTKHGIDLVRDYRDPGLVDGHHDELNQVWTNLIHNALQSMDHKGRLEVGVVRAGDEALVWVTDSGPGIPATVRDRIFEPFYTTKPAGEGSGLGLSISREIVDKHGGRIEVESAPGRTTFTVRLPRVRPPT